MGLFSLVLFDVSSSLRINSVESISRKHLSIPLSLSTMAMAHEVDVRIKIKFLDCTIHRAALIYKSEDL
jgi:hypothetical protein